MALQQVMGFGARDRRRGLSFALVAAITVHGALAMTFRAERAAAAPPAPTTELEIAEAPPPDPPKSEPEPPPPEEPKAEATPPPSAPVAKAAPVAAKAPAAAKASAVLTANDDNKSDSKEEPVSFVSDPNGTTYGSGVVAKGGTADVGAPGAKLGGASGATGTGTSPKAASTGGGDAIVPASDLGRAPTLGDADACKGYFPSAADEDAATVSLVVVVKPGGEVASASIASESPKGQGFGQAARTCLLAKKFVPGLDKSGKAVTTSTRVTVRFSR